MKKLSNFLYFIITFILLISCNFYISDILSNKLSEGWGYKSALVNITYAENTGAGFSIMQNSEKFLIASALIVLILIISYLFCNLKSLSKKSLLLFAFFVAGVLGNLTERIDLGYVRDFFELAFCNFPIFNLSDIFITIAMIGFACRILFSKRPIK